MSSPIFRRHFLLTAGMILISFTLLVSSFMFLSRRYVVADKKEDMTDNVNYAALLTQSLLDQGIDPADETFSYYGPVLSGIADADVLLCSEDGTVLNSISANPDLPDQTGNVISPTVCEQLLGTGSYSGMSNLDLYSTMNYTAGAVVNDSRSSTVYLVLLTSPARDLAMLWRSLATLFFFNAVAVLMIGFISSSVFSAQQVRPLRNVSAVVQRFGMGEYDARASEEDAARKDEIGELARNFNTMADSIASAEERRQEFVANISHELKTPMTTISGFTNGILDGTVPPERVNESLQVISSETARLSRLVRQMLDVSALQAKERVTSQVEFDITETMVQVIISLEGKIKSHHLDMDVHVPDDPVRVWGDPDGITQVCYNLLDNAAKFAAAGSAIGVTISTKGGKAYVSVRNQGETIPPEELSMIFDRFHKSDRSRSIDKEGVGLGLYIVKTILNNHKETINVTSENGVTEFVFTLTLVG